MKLPPRNPMDSKTTFLFNAIHARWRVSFVYAGERFEASPQALGIVDGQVILRASVEPMVERMPVTVVPVDAISELVLTPRRWRPHPRPSLTAGMDVVFAAADSET